MSQQASKSPFPGMDPYLEAPDLWPEFQGDLLVAISDLLAAGRNGTRSPEILTRIYATTAGEQHAEPYLAIQKLGDNTCHTVLSVISPVDKLTGPGRNAYRGWRQHAKDSRTNLVEIDLVLEGPSLIEFAREGLPSWDYAVFCSRATHPDRYEVYPGTLQKPLPKFRVPLAAEERDLVLDLQSAFARCFEKGDYAHRIDYCNDPGMPLNPEVHAWLDSTLAGQKLRKPSPAHDALASAAYGIWEREGRPHGRDREHWFQALARLRRISGPGAEGR